MDVSIIDITRSTVPSKTGRYLRTHPCLPFEKSPSFASVFFSAWKRLMTSSRPASSLVSASWRAYGFSIAPKIVLLGRWASIGSGSAAVVEARAGR